MIGLNTQPYCTCHATGTWQRQDGYSLDGPSGLWVHARCRKPSRMNYERLVLGLPQIPPTPKIENIEIFEKRAELMAWARKLTKEELDWDMDEEE